MEFHTLLQACCPDRLSDRLIAELFAEVVKIDRQARTREKKARYARLWGCAHRGMLFHDGMAQAQGGV